MKTYTLVITSPDGTIYEGEVSFLSLRGANGDLAVMAGHIPFVTSVSKCDCKVIFADSSERLGETDGGMLTVTSEKVTLLSGSFKWK